MLLRGTLTVCLHPSPGFIPSIILCSHQRYSSYSSADYALSLSTQSPTTTEHNTVTLLAYFFSKKWFLALLLLSCRDIFPNQGPTASSNFNLCKQNITMLHDIILSSKHCLDITTITKTFILAGLLKFCVPLYCYPICQKRNSLHWPPTEKKTKFKILLMGGGWALLVERAPANTKKLCITVLNQSVGERCNLLLDEICRSCASLHQLEHVKPLLSCTFLL